MTNDNEEWLKSLKIYKSSCLALDAVNVAKICESPSILRRSNIHVYLHDRHT